MTAYYVPGQKGFFLRDDPEENSAGDFRPLPEGAEAISEEQYRELLAAPAINWETRPPSVAAWMPNPELVARKQLNMARTAFVASDKTLLRCLENDVPFPVEWKNYRQQLRAFLNTDGVGDLPTAPQQFPAGS